MTIFTRLLRLPQQVLLRREIFWIHLCTSLALGLYVVALSVMGSVVVYRIVIDRLLVPTGNAHEGTTPMTVDQTLAAAARASRMDHRLRPRRTLPCARRRPLPRSFRPTGAIRSR
jgi:hypothetical protein